MPPPVAERLLACGRGYGDALACWEKKLTLGRQPSHACLGRRPNGLYCRSECTVPDGETGCIASQNMCFCNVLSASGLRRMPRPAKCLYRKSSLPYRPRRWQRAPASGLPPCTSRPGKPFTEQAGHIHGNSFRPLCPAMCVNGKKRQPPRRASRCGGCFTSLPGGNHNLSSCTVKWRIIGASHAMRTPLVTCSRRS